MRESDVRNFSAEAKRAYQHYITKKEYISDEYHLHVFKAAMLLISVISASNVSNLYSQTIQRKVSATRSTLYRCFAGQLTQEDVDSFLEDLKAIDVLSLEVMTNGDVRLQIPYGGGGDVFEIRKQILIGKTAGMSFSRRVGPILKKLRRSSGAKTWLLIAEWLLQPVAQRPTQSKLALEKYRKN